MSSIFNSDEFGLKLYSRFPPKYREDDVGQNYALKRYLQALSDGGFKYAIDEINGITTIIDPDKVDAKVLPVLFKHYGLDIFNGIPEEYLRYLLPKLGEAWSKKGSLSVVEFISSSLSGIKTTTEVAYDEKDNPTVNVILEMDYNLGDYFPEAEQFNRLLKNFIPFYCDMVLIYSYLFYEYQVIFNREKDFINITDTKNENGVFDLEDSYARYSVKQSLVETSNIKNNDESVATVKFEAVHSYGRLKALEHLQEKSKTIYSEGTSFSLVKKDPITERNAVLGEAILGKFNLGGYEFVDTFSDTTVDTKVESAHIKQPMDTFLNMEYNTLNGNFFTNGFSGYDKITIGGVTTIVFN